jgi:hypothetical protein
VNYMANENENNADEEPVEETASRQTSSSNLPFVVTLIALLLYFGYQTLHLTFERSQLGQVKASQEGAIQEAQKIHAQFKTLISKTGELADKGHAGAKLVIEGLQSQGFGVAADGMAPGQSETKPVK